MTMKAHIAATASLLDERQEARRTMTLETSGVLPGGEEANVTVHNLSSAGLLIESAIALDVGERLQIDLPETGPVDAEIVWKSERLYGCAFSAVLPQTGAPSKPVLSGSIDRLDRIGGEAFGSQINRLRRERGMTLADVADALGVSKPTVWAWEKGKARPLPERIGAIAQVLGVSEQELATSIETPSAGHDIVNECRDRIAAALSVPRQTVRVMVEL